MGEAALVDVHILVSAKISVSEGHLISETVRLSLIDQMPNIGEVMVHIDPEDDEVASPSVSLPVRKEMVARLEAAWEGIAERAQVKRVNLHYLDGTVSVEIELPVTIARETSALEALTASFVNASLTVSEVAQAKVLYS